MILAAEHAELQLAHAANRYRPSNGTEGEIFQSKFCTYCIHRGCTEGDYCEVLLRMHVHDVDDPDYPAALVYDSVGQPTCTAFRYLRPRERFDEVLDEISGISTKVIDGEVITA